MPRPFRLFSQYDFFSVFLPGLATLIGFYMLFPRELTLGPIVAIIPVLVLAFTFGQALHSLSAAFELLLGKIGLVTSHRSLFAERIDENSKDKERIHGQFKEKLSLLLRDDSLLLEEDGTAPSIEEWKAIYPTIQSYIYNSQVGRSRTFQAIYAFSRSMLILLAGLPVLYQLYHFLRQQGYFFDRPPKYLTFFPDFGEFIEVAGPLCWMGAILFLYSTYSYRRFFVQYLISDFVALRSEF